MKYWCSDGVSRLGLDRLESRPFLQVSVSKVSDLIMVTKAAGLETFNTGKKWFSKIM